MTTYVFVDESGDPGDVTSDGSNSTHYAEIALQVNDEGYGHFLQHVTNWRYIKGFFREFKRLPAGNDLDIFLAPICVLLEEEVLRASGVFLDKRDYNGPYLKEGGSPNPLRFRNFVLRQLLEFHFADYPAYPNDLELVFDRFDLSVDELGNLDAYLRNNWKLPRFKYITHLDSRYCEAMQLTGQLVNVLKDFGAGKPRPALARLFESLRVKNITTL